MLRVLKLSVSVPFNKAALISQRIKITMDGFSLNAQLLFIQRISK